MSIFNAVAALASGGGMEYEEGSFTISNSSTYVKQITFSNSHDTIPALVIAETISGTSTSRTTLSMIIVYEALFGTPRGKNNSNYAQRLYGYSTTGIATQNSYTSETISDDLTSSSATLMGNSSYYFYRGDWKWIAIWAPEN